jgi:hypothetical protein
MGILKMASRREKEHGLENSSLPFSAAGGLETDRFCTRVRKSKNHKHFNTSASNHIP